MESNQLAFYKRGTRFELGISRLLNSVYTVKNKAVVLHIERIVTLATGLNHFTSVYYAERKEVHAIDQESTRDEQAFFIGALREKCIENKRFIDLKVQENDIPLRLNTGAQCNVIPQIICKEKGFVVYSIRWSQLSPIQAMKSCLETKSRLNCVGWKDGHYHHN